MPNTQLATASTQTVPTASRIDLPRPAIIAAVGILVLAVTFLVTKPGDNSGTPAASAPATTNTTATVSSSSTASTGTAATTTAAAKPKEPPLEPGPGLPRDVARALNANKVVVLFFYEPAASDDQATKAAVRAVRSAGANRVRLFQDVVARISDYRRVVGSLGISQSPAMVVIDRNRTAQLLQGYLDSGTIKQTVRDAF